MKPLEDIYKATFFKRRNSLNWRAEPVCRAIAEVIKPESVIDVGCAIGDLIKGFDKLEILCYGVEGSIRAISYLIVEKDRVYIKDLRLPLNLGMYFDLVVCLEVAEHIEPEYADQFLSNLCSLSKNILMSAAPPGQEGHYHVNCQPNTYWETKLAAVGYIRQPHTEEKIKKYWEPWAKKKGIKAYYDNLLLFSRLR